MLHFANPELLALLLLLPFLGGWHWLRRRLGWGSGDIAPTLTFADVRLATPPRLPLRVRWRQPILRALFLSSLACLCIAIARPQRALTREVVRGHGIDIALSLDISGSMASLDFEPDNRLTAAKKVLAAFINERKYDRVGLVLFAGESYTQSPITLDHTMLQTLLSQVDFAGSLGLNNSTAIGLGLANAVNLLKDSKNPSRIVILLTDGVNTAGKLDPITAAHIAQTLNIRVYTIGMGKIGLVPVPVADRFGRVEMVMQDSKIDEAILQEMATLTGGKFYRAADPASLSAVYAEINNLEQSEVEVTTYQNQTELFAWFALPAFFLLLCHVGLRQTVFRSLP